MFPRGQSALKIACGLRKIRILIFKDMIRTLFGLFLVFFEVNGQLSAYQLRKLCLEDPRWCNLFRGIHPEFDEYEHFQSFLREKISSRIQEEYSRALFRNFELRCSAPKIYEKPRNVCRSFGNFLRAVIPISDEDLLTRNLRNVRG